MAVREQRYVAVCGVGPCDHAIDAGADLFRRFAARTPVAEDQPARPRLMDLRGRDAFVLAVIPLHQVGLDDGVIAEPDQLAGLAGGLHRADEDDSKALFGQDGTQSLSETPPVVGQRDVGRAGVLAAEAPLGLAVPDREDVHGGLRGQTLSASVERMPDEAASWPQLQFVISGMSSP